MLGVENIDSACLKCLLKYVPSVAIDCSKNGLD